MKDATGVQDIIIIIQTVSLKKGMKVLPEWLWGGGSRAGVQERVKQQLAFSFAAISTDHISLRGESFSNSTLGGERGKRGAFIPCHSERTLKTYLLCCFLQGVCYRVLISATIYWLLDGEKKLPEPGQSLPPLNPEFHIKLYCSLSPFCL